MRGMQIVFKMVNVLIERKILAPINVFRNTFKSHFEIKYHMCARQLPAIKNEKNEKNKMKRRSRRFTHRSGQWQRQQQQKKEINPKNVYEKRQRNT